MAADYEESENRATVVLSEPLCYYKQQIHSRLQVPERVKFVLLPCS